MTTRVLWSVDGMYALVLSCYTIGQLIQLLYSLGLLYVLVILDTTLVK